MVNFESIKAHVKRHEKVYWIGSLVVVAGVTFVVTRRMTIPKGGATNTAAFVFRNKQTIKITNVLDREGRGHPGWPVRNTETGHISFSQKQAAETFDISPNILSAHVRGHLPDAEGLHFERVNLVPAPS